jgi:hypothetical protein
VYDEGKIICLPISSVEMILSDTAAASVSLEHGSVFDDLWLFRTYSKRQCSTALTKLYFGSSQNILISDFHFLLQFVVSVQKNDLFDLFCRI